MKLSKLFWAGVLAGAGIGLMLGAALVELELMTSDRKAWVSLVGAVIFGVGVFLRGKTPERN